MHQGTLLMSTSRRQADLNVRLPDIIDPESSNVDGFAARDLDGNAVIKATPDEFAAAGIKTRPGGPDGTLNLDDDDGYVWFRLGPNELQHAVTDGMRADLDRGGLRGGTAIGSILAELPQIIVYGQSLGRGSEGTPALSTTPLPYAKMFVGGARWYDANNDLDDPANYASLVDLQEQDNGVAGETICTASAMMIAQLLLDEDDIDLSASDQELFYVNPSRSGRTVAELSSSPYIDDLYRQMDEGRDRADELDKSFAVSAMTFIQGEADYFYDTDPDVWDDSVRALRRAAQAHVLEATGVDRTLPLFLCQTASHIHYGHSTPGIALKQLAFADERPFVFVTPKHFMPYADEQHLNNIGYKWLGGYYGLAFKRLLFDGIKVQPLMPVEIERIGKRVYLRFDTPLVFDTTTIAADPDGFYGFRLADAAGDALALDSVTLIREDKVICITADADIPAYSYVRYAWEGPGTTGVGNVRDTQGDTIVFDPASFNKPLHRWLPIFERML